MIVSSCMSTSGAVCSQCGTSAETGRLFCEKCGAALRSSGPLISPDSPASDRHTKLWTVSIGDAKIFVFYFVFFFLVVHFDAFGRIPRARHPVPFGTSAWVALLIAVVGVIFTKLKYRHD